MNEYGFDYLNYINNIPSNRNCNTDYSKMNMNYSSPEKITTNLNYNPKKKAQMNFMDLNQTNYYIKPHEMKYQNMMSPEFSEPNTGWLRGNMFPTLYEEYKNYRPQEPNSKNEREALLFQIMQYKFANIDLNLYLDTHPHDKEALALYNKYLNIEKQMSDKYESMYGPLTLDSKYLDKNGGAWKNNPWPWEVM